MSSEQGKAFDCQFSQILRDEPSLGDASVRRKKLPKKKKQQQKQQQQPPQEQPEQHEQGDWVAKSLAEEIGFSYDERVQKVRSEVLASVKEMDQTDYRFVRTVLSVFSECWDKDGSASVAAHDVVCALVINLAIGELSEEDYWCISRELQQSYEDKVVSLRESLDGLCRSYMPSSAIEPRIPNPRLYASTVKEAARRLATPARRVASTPANVSNDGTTYGILASVMRRNERRAEDERQATVRLTAAKGARTHASRLEEEDEDEQLDEPEEISLPRKRAREEEEDEDVWYGTDGDSSGDEAAFPFRKAAGLAQVSQDEEEEEEEEEKVQKPKAKRARKEHKDDEKKEKKAKEGKNAHKKKTHDEKKKHAKKGEKEEEPAKKKKAAAKKSEKKKTTEAKAAEGEEKKKQPAPPATTEPFAAAATAPPAPAAPAAAPAAAAAFSIPPPSEEPLETRSSFMGLFSDPMAMLPCADEEPAAAATQLSSKPAEPTKSADAEKPAEGAAPKLSSDFFGAGSSGAKLPESKGEKDGTTSNGSMPLFPVSAASPAAKDDEKKEGAAAAAAPSFSFLSAAASAAKDGDKKEAAVSAFPMPSAAAKDKEGEKKDAAAAAAPSFPFLSAAAPAAKEGDKKEAAAPAFALPNAATKEKEGEKKEDAAAASSLNPFFFKAATSTAKDGDKKESTTSAFPMPSAATKDKEGEKQDAAAAPASAAGASVFVFGKSVNPGIGASKDEPGAAQASDAAAMKRGRSDEDEPAEPPGKRQAPQEGQTTIGATQTPLASAPSSAQSTMVLGALAPFGGTALAAEAAKSMSTPAVKIDVQAKDNPFAPGAKKTEVPANGFGFNVSFAGAQQDAKKSSAPQQAVPEPAPPQPQTQVGAGQQAFNNFLLNFKIETPSRVPWDTSANQQGYQFGVS